MLPGRPRPQALPVRLYSAYIAVHIVVSRRHALGGVAEQGMSARPGGQEVAQNHARHLVRSLDAVARAQTPENQTAGGQVLALAGPGRLMEGGKGAPEAGA